MEFNKELFQNNVKFLANYKGIRIGSLENSLGVCTGYFARLKSNSATPSISLIAKLADLLEVSIDTLISQDLSSLQQDKLNLYTLLQKMINKTIQSEIHWKRESKFEYKEVLLESDY